MPDIMNPKEGDVFTRPGCPRLVVVDKVDADGVCWRLTDGQGGLLTAHRCSLEDWRAMGEAEVGDE